MEIYVLKKQGKRGWRLLGNWGGNTVQRYLRDSIAVPQYKKARQQASKLDLFKPYLHERIAAAKSYWFTATVLFREIQAQCYQGKEGILWVYVRQFARLFGAGIASGMRCPQPA